MLYSTPKICIKNNGNLSNYFNIQHGIRQGCPVSALLFVLMIELLAHQLENNKLLHGVSVKTNNTLTEYKCIQYADDINLFHQDEFQVDKALTIIDDFSSRAGPKLNILKNEDSLGNPARCLDIYIGNDKINVII